MLKAETDGPITVFEKRREVGTELILARFLPLLSTAVIAVAILVLSSSCSSSKLATSPAQATISATETPNWRDNSEDIARRALQAVIDNDRATFTELMRPNYTAAGDWDDQASKDLRGCDLQGAHFKAVPQSEREINYVVTFETPCYTDSNFPDLGPQDSCDVFVWEMGGHWWLESVDCQ